MLQKTIPTAPSSPRTTSKTEEILGIDWASFFPRPSETPPTTIELLSISEAMEFAAEHQRTAFGGTVSESPIRNRFYSALNDSFGLKVDGSLRAVLIGNLSDWGTYYIRFGIVPASFQHNGVMQELLGQVLLVLGEIGLERVETHTHTQNTAVQRLLLRAGFIVTGSIFSERWGAQLLWTNYLQIQSQERFEARFSDGIPAHQRFTSKERRNS